MPLPPSFSPEVLKRGKHSFYFPSDPSISSIEAPRRSHRTTWRCSRLVGKEATGHPCRQTTACPPPTARLWIRASAPLTPDPLPAGAWGFGQVRLACGCLAAACGHRAHSPQGSSAAPQPPPFPYSGAHTGVPHGLPACACTCVTRVPCGEQVSPKAPVGNLGHVQPCAPHTVQLTFGSHERHRRVPGGGFSDVGHQYVPVCGGGGGRNRPAPGGAAERAEPAQTGLLGNKTQPQL